MLVGSGSIGGALTTALIEAWREWRAQRHKAAAVALQQQQAEDAGRRAAEQKWQELGLRHVEVLEQRLTSAEKKVEAAEERANTAEERADAAEETQRAMQTEISRMQHKQAERDAEIIDIRQAQEAALARAEREMQARIQAEAAARAAAAELDTLRLEKAQLEARYQQAQDEQNRKIANLSARLAELEKDRVEREARHQAELQAERARTDAAKRELAEMRKQTQRLTEQVGELRAEVERLRKIGTGRLLPMDAHDEEAGDRPEEPKP